MISLLVGLHYYACRAEKQLIAYFINRHAFLEPAFRAPEKRHYTMDRVYLTVEDLAEAFRKNAKLEFDKEGSLRQLTIAMPPVVLKQALILVSSQPCGDCTGFIESLKLNLGLNISLRSNNDEWRQCAASYHLCGYLLDVDEWASCPPPLSDMHLV